MKLKSKAGQALVEFALILPLLLILFFGIIEFSLALYNKIVITNACREGARAGIVMRIPRMDAAGIEQIVMHYCQNNLISFSAGDLTVTSNPQANPPSPTYMNELTVNVQYNYGYLALPSFVPLIPNPLPLRAQTVMRYE